MPKRILVIEDNVDLCQNIASILKLGRYDVLISNTGKLGIELAQKNLPDLILCDIVVPELDGYSVLRLLGNDPATTNIPFIFLTSKTELRDFRKGMNLGADDYITKPFDGDELLTVIELRIRKNELIKTTFPNTINDIDDFFNKVKQSPETQKLSDHPRPRIYKKNEFVFVEGEQLKYAYFITNGLVKTFKATNDGKELITGFHRRGNFFGFVAVLEGKPNNESAIVLKEAQIYMIPQQDFLTLIYANKEIARKFMSMLASNLYDAENKLLELAYLSVRQRVAAVLIKLNNQSDFTNKDQSIILARKDISSLVGTTTESLNRTIVDFKNEGLIEVHDRLRIVEPSKLEKMRT
jgi:CRP-like cAMP-binding protein/ActR/RegA family two-component response regulator